MNPLVLAADALFLYLMKPAGLPVFPRGADEASDTLLARLLAECPDQGAVAWPEGYEGGVLHRLDNQTSGLLVAARNLDALEGS